MCACVRACVARLKVGKAGSAVHAMATNQAPPPPPNAGIVHGQVLNCYKAMHDYLTRMVSTVKGMKALLLDQETVRIMDAHTYSATRRHAHWRQVLCCPFVIAPWYAHRCSRLSAA